MEDGAPKLGNMSVSYAFVPPPAWEVRDKILSEMQRLGASHEEVKRIVGPEPPRIEYGLLQGPMPKIGLEPGEQWLEEWAKSASVAFEEYKTRQIATYRQAYCSFMGEGEDPEPPNRRKLKVKNLIEGAALHLLAVGRHPSGRPWKNIGHTDATRKAVNGILKWTRLDSASIARNTGAAARGIIKQIETWHEQGNELAEDDQRQLADAKSTLARLSASSKAANRNETKSRKAIGRPKRDLDVSRVVELKHSGTPFSSIAKELKIPGTTVRRAYKQASVTTPPKLSNRK